MDRVEDAQDLVAETLAWLLYGGNRRVAAWAADAGWVLVAYGLVPRETWSRECEQAAKWRESAYRYVTIIQEGDGGDLSSPRL